MQNHKPSQTHTHKNTHTNSTQTLPLSLRLSSSCLQGHRCVSECKCVNSHIHGCVYVCIPAVMHMCALYAYLSVCGVLCIDVAVCVLIHTKVKYALSQAWNGVIAAAPQHWLWWRHLNANGEIYWPHSHRSVCVCVCVCVCVRKCAYVVGCVRLVCVWQCKREALVERERSECWEFFFLRARVCVWRPLTLSVSVYVNAVLHAWQCAI